MKLMSAVGKAWLAANGWRVENRVPAFDKCVIIAAPHTSNWDFPYTIAIAEVLQLPFFWLGKHTLFEGPFGWFFRKTGGIPVDRRSRQDYVRKIADFIAEQDRIAIALAPEGTRGHSEFWKSGFYHIAKTANVPIVLGFVDYANRVGGLGKAIWPIGTEAEVMDEVREFYQASMGFSPDQFVEPRLRSEVDE